ncbi:hypothetical protein AXG93_4368s2100 [Marchantia polymorpha subsp. ruderalis]|uniref:Smr domain-containing protein n=1 Tax=Marchantia polymorpha subsp. ruderalis TaxID=1480154 RepID=A0A176VY66_MARPO|nr:hypothetical protein AXG93_4368s2100 [Marchantia polymorpha subsp. ruderalis]
MRGVSVYSTFGYRGEVMASDREWFDTWLHQSRTPPRLMKVQTSEDELDAEHQNLRMLLNVFPGISLPCIAEAYTLAEGDPNYAAELLAHGSSSKPISDVRQKVGRNVAPHELSEEAQFFDSTCKPLESVFHFEKMSEQLKKVEKQEAGSVVSHEAPGAHNHSGRPPEENSGLSFGTQETVWQSACQLGITFGGSSACMGGNGGKILSNSSALGCVGGTAAGNGASNGTGNVLSDSGSSLLPGWKGFNVGKKVSAISGTVSCHRQQRRNGFSHFDAGKDSKEHRDGDEVLFYGKQRKKKKGGMNRNDDCGSFADDSVRQTEDFLYSMLGDSFELGIDVVRDVLEHFSGDTNEALETLLHMASTSPGFHCTELPDQVSEPLQNLIQVFPNMDPAEVLIAFQECDEDIVQAINAILQKELVLKESMAEDDSVERTQFDHVLSTLHESFPTVERSFLSEVLQASECSYGDAVQALKEAGMTPVNERAQTKVDPAEVLQALFRREPESSDAGSSCEQNTNGELYTVVAARPRARSCATDSKIVKAKVDEYERHRATANELWSKMKKCFQEAAAAHSRGQRALAGDLSQKGQLYKAQAREASLRASENIFNVKNRDIENNISIDLHAQHVQEAFRLLKLHLRSLSSISSVHTLTVITGHGSHSASGRARIKPALTEYLAKTHIPWAEPNAGCLVIKMCDVRTHYPGHKSSDSSSESESQ